MSDLLRMNGGNRFDSGTVAFVKDIFNAFKKRANYGMPERKLMEIATFVSVAFDLKLTEFKKTGK